MVSSEVEHLSLIAGKCVAPGAAAGSFTAGCGGGLIHQQGSEALLTEAISTELSREVAELAGQLEAERARAERLVRALSSERQKRAAGQEKNTRLKRENSRLEYSLAWLISCRRRTARTLQALRTTLREERAAAGTHFRARRELEAIHKETRESAELLHTQSVNGALQLARFVERTNTLTLQVSGLQGVLQAAKVEAFKQKALVEAVQRKAEQVRADAEATTEAYHARQREIEYLDGEVERLTTALEEAREALLTAVARAEEAEQELEQLQAGGGA